MVKLYNTFYDLDVVKRTKDLVDLPQGMIVSKFNILYGNDISGLAEGSVVMVTDIKLKTLGFFRKYKDENKFNIRDRGANWDVVFMDVTSHTGLDFDAKDYFKEDKDNLKYTCFSDPSNKERFDDALEENYTKTSTGYILNEKTDGSSDKDLGFSGAIKRAQERNNAKKENSERDKDLTPSPFSTFLQSHRRNVLNELAESNSKVEEMVNKEEHEPKLDGYEEDAVNQPSHYTSGDIEVIEYIEQQAKVMYESGTVPPEVIPHICNAIKYISRFQSKGKPVEDLNKSIYYINRAIKNIEDFKE